MQHISILGCGWLGLPLASHFITQGFEVSGSTTSQQKISLLTEAKINPYLMELPDQIEANFFEKAEVIIINIPPQTSRKGKDFHKRSIEAIIPLIKPHQKIIYVSSTSVYPDDDKAISEETALDQTSERAEALIQVETLLLKHYKDRLTILRFGGLLGYNRIPGSYTAGKTIEGGHEKVNYIHRDDAIGIISEIIIQEKWGFILNGVAPKHPTKKEVYKANAENFAFEKTSFIEIEKDKRNRYIEGGKLELLLDYSFIFPDPLGFNYTI